MKRILTAFMVLLLSLLLSTCSLAEIEPETDYISQMVEAAVKGDLVLGREAEYLHRQHLSALGAEDSIISFDELFLLAKFIQLQSSSLQSNETLMLCMGEVVLNRLASREFPNSLAEVIYQPGEFEGVDNNEFQCQSTPSKYCVLLALRLLNGERLLAPHVVHWSMEPQTDAYATFCDRRQNFVYFCESEYPRFYHLPNKKTT